MDYNNIEPDSGVVVDELGKPVYKSITINNAKYYYNQYINPNSKFRKWIDENANKINTIQLPTLECFYRDNINDIKKIIHINNPDLLVKGIIFFLFGFDIVKQKKMFRCQSAGHNDKYNKCYGQIGGRFSINEKVSSEKRIVLLIENDGKKYIVKVSPFIEKLDKNVTDSNLIAFHVYSEVYKNEANIYLELNNGLKSTKLSNNIIKIYAYKNNINILNEKNLTIFYDEGGSKYFIIGKETTNKLKTLSGPTNGIIQYIVLEFNDDYDSLRNFLDINDEEEINSVHRDIVISKLIVKVLQILLFLSFKFGFHHLDLHNDNLLVKKDGSDIKFYDFDQSITQLHQNEFVTKLLPKLFGGQKISTLYKNEPNKINDICLLYDILRFIERFIPYDSERDDGTTEYNFFDESIVTDSKIINLDKYLSMMFEVFDNKMDNVNTPEEYYDVLQTTAIEFYNKKINGQSYANIIKNIINDISTSTQKGGYKYVDHDEEYYKQKYFKYKAKYMGLKSELF